jgi:gamma-glutamyltranspeptidase / glutathione hydrolase
MMSNTPIAINLSSLTTYPYPSGRRVVMGSRGAVATGQPLATLAGMEMLLAGGNAVDAAIATAVALTVVEPTGNGIGGDAFAIVWDGQLHGLNASGYSPYALNPEQCAGYDTMPTSGWLPVTVPGAVSGWVKLWQKWGALPFAKLFEPAIRYAEEGFPVSPTIARIWQRVAPYYLALEGKLFEPFQTCYFPNGQPPKAGQIWRNPDQAKTLCAIAETEGEAFYHGEIAQRILEYASETDGLLTTTDFTHHEANWVNPISADYRGYTLWEIPPSGQGIAALMALKILEGFEIAQYPRESVDSYHLQIEAMKLAFSDVQLHVADPDFMTVAIEQLLRDTYAEERRSLISKTAISACVSGLPKGDTVYLATADRDLMVSFIQSNYQTFGSGILVPGTGITLHNRGSGFSCIPGHPNQVAPHKRPFHTIIPGFLTQGNLPLGPIGVMGAHMQPQGHLQTIVNLIDYQMNPQAALDAPRWRFNDGNSVSLEQSIASSIVQGLKDKGHGIEISADPGDFGKGQILLRLGETLVAASEPRTDGLALAL